MGPEVILAPKQTISERVLQSVKILQMPIHELESYVNELALENPAIEIVEKPKESIEAGQWSAKIQEARHYRTQRQNNDDDFDPKRLWNISSDTSETLIDALWSQLRTEEFSPQERTILVYMLENLDDRGYLPLPLEEISNRFHTNEQTVLTLLHLLQSLEPPGICARDLPECLLLQLKARGISDIYVKQIIEESLDLVGKSKYSAMASRYHLTKAAVVRCCELIKTLNPIPARGFGSGERK